MCVILKRDSEQKEWAAFWIALRRKVVMFNWSKVFRPGWKGRLHIFVDLDFSPRGAQIGIFNKLQSESLYGQAECLGFILFVPLFYFWNWQICSGLVCNELRLHTMPSDWCYKMVWKEGEVSTTVCRGEAHYPLNYVPNYVHSCGVIFLTVSERSQLSPWPESLHLLVHSIGSALQFSFTWLLEKRSGRWLLLQKSKPLDVKVDIKCAGSLLLTHVILWNLFSELQGVLASRQNLHTAGLGSPNIEQVLGNVLNLKVSEMS